MTVTDPGGFAANGVAAGIKASGDPDLSLVTTVDGAPVAAAGDGNGAAPDDPFGLTPRERQVLALLSQGATNREIGAQLYMAEKTASVHVSRILSKLEVRSRTEAAGVAHRLGLAG